MRNTLIAILLLAALAGGIGVVVGITAASARRANRQPSMAKSGNPATEDSASSQVDVIRFVDNPQPAPPFLANDLNGNVVSSAGLQGKVVILNFWATWCPPCREEIPDLIRLQNRYKDRLQIIGISMDDDASPEEVKAFAGHMGINYPVLMGRYNQKIPATYGGANALPTSFIFDTQGRVMTKHEGLFPAAVYETEIRSLLGMPVSAKVVTFEDNGQVFLQNAGRATQFPGVDLSALTPEQKKIVIKRVNSEGCTCGCKLTIAQCRISDESCATSKTLAAKIVKEVLAGMPAPATTAKSD